MLDPAQRGHPERWTGPPRLMAARGRGALLPVQREASTGDHVCLAVMARLLTFLHDLSQDMI